VRQLDLKGFSPKFLTVFADTDDGETGAARASASAPCGEKISTRIANYRQGGIIDVRKWIA